ncbi:hypothetical protein RDI58_008399 [Solanum bulbocastanum]|uniref:Uncharacterized protein n=1 Tax=Solanum bulbocastanum TaxID=147425 RepID=A0AAN8U2A2_SOLBU
MTGEHQLIPYPKSSTNDLEKIGLAVDYPKSDQYKLVTVSSLVENSNLLYKFHLLSSEQPGLKDGRVLVFDTKREEAILIDHPEFLDSYEHSYGKILSGQSIWLGKAQGLLTLVCIFRMHIAIATYGSASRRWRVSHNLGNFILGPEGIINCFPVWIDNKQVSFLVQRLLTLYYDLYEYNTNINVYEHTAVLHGVKLPMFCFHPTLAGAHYTPSNNIEADDQAHIAANLDDIRRFIIEGTSSFPLTFVF